MRPPQRLTQLVWLSYAALLLGMQASISFAWISHAFFPAGSGAAATRAHAGGLACATAPRGPPGSHHLLDAAAPGSASASSSSSSSSAAYCRQCGRARSGGARMLTPAQSSATVRLCAALVRGGAAARNRKASATELRATAVPLGGNDGSASPLLGADSLAEGGDQQAAGGQAGATGGVASSSSSSSGPPVRRQKLSSTVGILGAGAMLTALAAVVPVGFDKGAPSLLSVTLAALRPAEGVVLTGTQLYWRIFLAGGVCASISHGWAVPLDVVKTRLQTDPERYKGLGIWGAFDKIRREEGPGMLLKGLGATLAGYSIQGSLKYGLYAIFKVVVKGFLPTASIFVTWVLASIIADFIASTALCPLEATRIRMVADPAFASGTFEGISKLVENEGPGSIFKGMPAILAKQLPYTIVQLCGFELITWLFYSWEATAALLHAHKGGWGQWLVSFGSAMITAVFASLASQPGDVILSRVNKDRSSKPVLATMSDTVRELGPRGLFKGTRARLLHVGMIVTIQLVIYDFVKQLVGLPATGAH